MRFSSNVSKKDYILFYKNHDRTFMQSYEWGEFNKEVRNQNPHYVGLYDDNGKLVAVSLLLEKKLFFGYSYFYAPRGFLLDYNNLEILTEFSKYLYEYIKKNKGIFLRHDPEIKYQTIDIEGNVIKEGDNNYELFNNLLKLGYKHNGFTKEFESTQPRYTFRIDLEQDLDQIKSNINKSIIKKINKTYEYDMLFRETSDTDTFYNLIQNNSIKDNFNSYSKDYYKTEYEILGTKDIIKVFELVINPNDLYKKTIKKLEELISSNSNNKNQNIERQNKIKNILEPFKKDRELVICSQICALTSKGMWSLYIGNNNIGTELYAVNRMYYEMINYGKEHKCSFLDFFGTIGSTNIKHKSLIGIHNYKKNYGGEYTEFIGEFDLVNKKILYFIFIKLIPIYRNIRKKLIKIGRRNNEN